ncbi:MAG: phosphopantothenoylcysteine decarboxylase [Planctomycetes bacterium]|nr:phosphopantothenoylcysteine decarboxylase [Planctomycetota bacterium]
MTRILITSGPTRQYLDPVRYLSNASSGRMGRALAEAALAFGHRVTIVSGPVGIEYPRGAEVIGVVSTDEMLDACRLVFPDCDGLIAAAAPCDYRPEVAAAHKMSKTGEPLALRLVETADIVAALARTKRPAQWIVGFALETEDHRLRALAKLERKSCDLMVVNGPAAMNAATNHVEVMRPDGAIVEELSGTKEAVARGILQAVQSLLIDAPSIGDAATRPDRNAPSDQPAEDRESP